jgi:hypothetical protein
MEVAPPSSDVLEASCSAKPSVDWSESLRRLAGGFFQSPAVVAAALPPGAPLFVTVRRKGETVGLGVGVGQRCRLGVRALHVRMAAPPAAAASDRAEVLRALGSALLARGAVELDVGSFGAAGLVPVPPGAESTTDRTEYLVVLRGREDQLKGFGTTHRRHCRRGDREGWTLRLASPAETESVLYRVQADAATRGALRDNPFTVASMGAEALSALAAPGTPQGVACFVAEAGAQLLGAALVGWAGAGAFYLRGGSTPEGYAEHVGAWLHWSIMDALHAQGITTYNLGGTPALAAEPDHPQHGLYRFKLHFGAEPIPCRGFHWALRPRHLLLHRAARRVTGSAF